MRQRTLIVGLAFSIVFGFVATVYAQGTVFLPIVVRSGTGAAATPTATSWWWPTSTPTLTPTATPTAKPTFTPTPTPTPMRLGDTFQFEGIEHSVVSYEETTVCPNGYSEADPGAKLVIFWIRSSLDYSHK